MTDKIDLAKAYRPSEEVVVREIEGETVIVPLTSGVGDLEDELLTLNETGRAVWARLDGSRPLAEIIRDLEAAYDAPDGVIREDVIGLLQELCDRRMIVAGE
ncbi:MAG TPA: PqqD family protein [Candidatus Aminicenantes bacterium]|nr:PqqD family protein [Candidatus Aminicenantes bacterium]HRY64328.1 PqqD family protein [Candidatus Aminicenantes bacterium]HRZ71241.1 PqqD family protein [Candidatus Aminicenantes bacterium]